MKGEWSRYYRHAALHDLEVLHARFIEHRFARHSHEYYVIGIVEAGVQAYPTVERDTSRLPVRSSSSTPERPTPGRQRRMRGKSTEQCIRGLR